jgi:hypothetical protein
MHHAKHQMMSLQVPQSAPMPIGHRFIVSPAARSATAGAVTAKMAPASGAVGARHPAQRHDVSCGDAIQGASAMAAEIPTFTR